jgi:hypothetical protein
MEKTAELTDKQQRMETYDSSVPKNGDNLTLNLFGAEANMSVRIEATLSYSVESAVLRTVADLIDAVYRLENEDVKQGTVPGAEFEKFPNPPAES